jgi:hypothetical protein
MYKEMELDIADYVYLEFSDGLQFTLVMFGDVDARGTYTRDKNNLTFTAGSETPSTTMSGNKITLVYDNGAKLVFEKK